MKHLISAIVVTGEGFTPQMVDEVALQKVFRGKPTQVLTTPVFTAASYPQRRQVLIQPDRLEVRVDQPSSPVDGFLGRAITAMVKLWPLAKIKSAGLNFFFGEPYDGTTTQEVVTGRLLQTAALESIFDAKLTGSEHSLRFPYEDALINLTISTSGLVDQRPGIVTQVNIHREPIDSPEVLLRTQQRWYDIGRRWSEKIIHG